MLPAVTPPLASDWRRRVMSAADCWMSTYMGSVRWITASGVAWLALTSAPGVTSERPIWPPIGAVIVE